MGMKINAELPLPAELKAEYPLSEEILRIKEKRDREIRDIFTGKSDKFIVIVGPCSADNEESVCEYVSRLAAVNDRVSDRLMLIPESIPISRGRPARDTRECSTSRNGPGAESPGRDHRDPEAAHTRYS